MLDKDLAELYGVKTKALNQAVKRNIRRFPKDFMFQLSEKEKIHLVTICDHLQELKYSYQLPYAFTEQGVAMLSSVLNSSRAIDINILIMRAFVKLRKNLLAHKDLMILFRKLEGKVGRHDIEIGLIMRAIEKMIKPEPKPPRKIGFQP